MGHLGVYDVPTPRKTGGFRQGLGKVGCLWYTQMISEHALKPQTPKNFVLCSRKGSAKLPTLPPERFWLFHPKRPRSFDTEQILESAAPALLDREAPASHLDPEHFRQFCPKCSVSSKSEIEVPRPVLPPSLRNFQHTKHYPSVVNIFASIAQRYLLRTCRGKPQTPMPPAGGSCGFGRTGKGGT